MARSRARGPDGNYWPGFVDALTTLLLVIIFLLVVFVLAQVVLSQAISGKDAALDRLNQQVEDLADLLDLERRQNVELRLDVSRLSASLEGARGRRDALELLLEQMSQRGRELEARAQKTEAALVAMESRVDIDRESVQLRVRQLESLRRDIQALRELRAELEADVALLNAGLDDSKDRVMVLDDALAQSRDEVRRLNRARDELVATLESRRLRIVALEAEDKALGDKLEAADSALSQSRTRARDLAGELADARRIAAALLREMETATAEKTRLTARAEALTAEKETLTARAGALTAEKETLTARAEALTAENATLTARARSLATREAEVEAETIRIIDELRATRLLIAALREDKTVLERERERFGERAEEEHRRLRLSEARGEVMAEAAAVARRQLGALRDRTKALEARLADERERTLLAQKELAAREVRLAELVVGRDEQAAAVREGRAALDQETKLSERRRLQVALLNLRIEELRREIQRLSAALDLAEAKDVESRASIKDLGRRLNRALAAKVEELSRYRSEFFGRLKEVLGDRRDVEVVGDRFVFQSEVLFASGSDQLGAAGREQLARLARALLEIAVVIPPEIDWVLRVDGHTDNRPIRTRRFPSNWELSTARAISVVHFLVENGVPPGRLAATGFAEFQSIDTRDDEVGYRRNRRIELKLTQR